MEVKFETSFEAIAAKNIGNKNYVVEFYSKLQYQVTSVDYEIRYEKINECFFENEEEQVKLLQDAIENIIEVYNRKRLWEGENNEKNYINIQPR